MEKEIASFSKNRTELVKVRLQDFKDKQYVDIRVWMKPTPENLDGTATSKGITLHVDPFPNCGRRWTRPWPRWRWAGKARNMTEEEIQKAKAEIDGLSQFEMCRLWRFAPPGHPFFRGEIGEYFHKKLKEKGGMTSEISKALGWKRRKGDG